MVDDRAAQERVRELTFEIQRLKEPEEASPERKALYKAAFNFCRAIRVGYGGTGELDKQLIDKLDTADPSNELNTRRVALLREMWKIYTAKFQQS